MNNEAQTRVEHFATLKSKYQATTYEDSSPSSLLYFILRKADLGIEITEIERNWLREHKLLETLEAIRKEHRYREKELRKLESEFSNLKSKYKAINNSISWQSSPLYFILSILDSENKLTDTEVKWLKYYGLTDTILIDQEMEQFATLKATYQATKHQDSSPVSRLYRILKQLDAKEQLRESEIGWLEQNELTETLDIVREFEQKRHFVALKAKYKATQYEDSSSSSHLYKVLKRLDSENQLGEQDINFLKKRKLTETITIAQDKYAASLKSKIESGEQLEESQIDWLKENGRENIIAIAQAKHFATLKSKYDVSDYKDKSPSSSLYAILRKLEKGERLEPTEVAWLQENKTEWRQLFSGKIFITYHKIEATFYEQEYKRTGNQWNLPNASSHWRKADRPKQALKLTENLNFDKIKENKLKSAILTTRGGAFRDIEELDKAEKCARQAIEYQPNSHHPYTLMGAICFERGQYPQGEYWFAEAIKRGASPRDQDAEIKRVVKNAKDENKRREVVEYLLKKEPQRYAWAKSYLKKPQNKGK